MKTESALLAVTLGSSLLVVGRLALGQTWILTNTMGSSWYSIACSADGDRLVAVSFTSGPIYTSTNSGADWITNHVPTKTWGSVASSADGSKLVALAGSLVYTSTNSGTGWSSHTISGSPLLLSVASSVDGNCLIVGGQAALNQGGLIYTSTNAGTTWRSNAAPATSGRYYHVASSADGNKLVAALSGASANGPIFTSANGGMTWTSNSVVESAWSSVVSSADGNNLAVVGSAGRLYVSHATPNPVLNLTSGGGVALISWLIPARDFALQQNVNPTTANWTEVANMPTLNLTNLRNEASLPLAPGSVCYRLKCNP